MPIKRRSRAVRDSDDEQESVQVHPQQKGRKRQQGPGPDLDADNILEAPRKRKKTPAQATLDYEQQVKQLQKQLAKKTTELAQARKDHALHVLSSAAAESRVRIEPRDEGDEDGDALESEEELDRYESPPRQFRSLGTLPQPSRPKTTRRNLVPLEDHPPPRRSPSPLSPSAPRLQRIPSGSPAPSTSSSQRFRQRSPSLSSESSRVSSARRGTISSRASSRSCASPPPPSRSSSPTDDSRHSRRRSQSFEAAPAQWQGNEDRFSARDPEVGLEHGRPAVPNSSQSQATSSRSHSREPPRQPQSHSTNHRSQHDQRQQHANRRSRSPTRRPLDSISYTEGRMPTNRKPKLGDYDKVTRALISRACGLYSIDLITIHAFPSPEQALIRAQDAWSTVCRNADKSFSDADSARVHTLILNQASAFRGHLRDRIRPLIVEKYGFNTATSDPVSGPEVRAANVRRYHYLLEGSPPRYCYKNWDISEPEGYAGHPLLMQALREQLFGSPQDHGSCNQARFNPIPLPTIAFLFTIIRFCLDQWTHGERNDSLKFKEDSYGDSPNLPYAEHLAWVKEWSDLKPDMVRRVRANMFTQLLNSSHVQPAAGQASARLSSDARRRLQAELDAYETMEETPSSNSGSSTRNG